MDQLNQSAYEDVWTALGEQLGDVQRRAGLGAALRCLQEHQIGSGFIQDDLSAIQRFRLNCPVNPERYFSAQYNPARGRRFQGAGRITPGAAELAINGGCFLCAENVWWQHQGAETGYHLPLAGARYTAWMNPFPLLPGHAVIASREHRPQHWQAERGLALTALARDLLELSVELPDWLCFYNGVGAGASIPHHLHYHAIPRAPGYECLPLERATSASDYPLHFMRWQGSKAAVLDQSLPWLDSWSAGPGAQPEASANIIALVRSDQEGVTLYFIPRHQQRSRAEGLDGVIGGFEALGEIVCSSDEALAKLASGRVDYFTIERMLAEVSVTL